MSDECKHSRGFIWTHDAVNETGWRCYDCDFKPGDPPGYDPGLDRTEILDKCRSILFVLHESGIVYVSNSTDGEVIAGLAAKRCKAEQAFDAWSVARVLLQLLADGSHADFWRERARIALGGDEQ